MVERNEMLASEVLYSFVGWLTISGELIMASCKHDAAIWAELVDKFIKVHKLIKPRDGWEKQWKRRNE